jgi:hypothetical protein
VQKYIVVDFGAPHVADSLPNCAPRNRLAVIERTWEDVHAFDGQSRYRVDADHVPKFGTIARILAYSFYNPMLRVPVDANWTRCGQYQKSDLVSLVMKGLEHDDDSIQQWFGGDEVVKLLENAQSWDDTLLAVEAICGAHEGNSEVLNYVERVLGQAP